MNGCTTKPSELQIQCPSRTEGFNCDNLAEWKRDGSAYIQMAESYVQCKKLLEMAKEDLRQCND